MDFSSSQVANVEQIAIPPTASQLFTDKPNSDLYWEALILAGKNHTEEAKKVVAALQSDDYKILSPAWKEEQPKDIDTFFDKLFVTTVFRDPAMLSYLGLFESIGVRDHNAYLTEISPKAIRRDFEEQKANWEVLKRYRVETLSPDQAISYKIFSWKLGHMAQGEKFLFHNYFINQMHGVVQDLTAIFLIFHKLEVKEDIDNYVARLSRIPEYLDQAIEMAEYQKQKKVLPPRFAIEKVISIINKFMTPSVEENIFYTHLATHLKESDPALAKAKAIMQKKVYPAYQKLKKHLTTLLETAQTNHGVWALPDGDAYYSYILQHHTTTNLTADEIHQLGLKEVKRIQAEIRAILELEGIMDPKREVGEIVAELSQDPQFYYPNTHDGRSECLVEFEAILERCRKQLWPLFDLKPHSKVVLKPVPKHEEEGAPSAYYYPSSIDGSRPGAFYVNLRDLNELPKYRMQTLAIHEAEPGHHFQCTIEKEMDIPVLRKVGHYTAYTEGWALYTEKLAYEENFYTTSFDKLGHLQDELLRAVRLVVDTGIHAKRWSREQAIDYMSKVTGDTKEGVVTEIERYFVCPGQACAYKVGQLKILDLRKKAKDRLKDKFNIREFHNAVLKVGTVPLAVLEEVVDQYIREKLGT